MTALAAALGALGVVALLLARDRRLALAGLALTLLGTVGLVVGAGPAGRLESLAGGIPGLALAVGALAALALAAAVLHRFPAAVVPLLLVAAPLRLPLEASGGSPLLLNLAGAGGLGRLYPFYAALAAATLALAWRLARGAAIAPLPWAIAVPAAALIGLTAISLLWSRDPAAGADLLIFFWLPLAVLVPVVANARLSPRALATTLIALGCAFAVLGIGQALTRELLFFTVALERANELGPFRVTSAFQDPNHFGRFLVLAIAVVLVAAWTGGLRPLLAAALSVVLGAALYFTYSQSSMVALAVVALAVALAAGDWRARRVIAAVAAVLVVAGVAGLVAGLAGGSAEAVTSDRSTLVTDTAGVFARHPLAGVGVGAQPVVTRDEAEPGTATIQNASHTTPLTVAAELGVVGLVAYVALLVGAARVLAELGRRDPPLALGVGAVLLALFVHSLFYGGFFENPIAFGVLGAAAGAVGARGVPGRAGRLSGRGPPGALR